MLDERTRPHLQAILRAGLHQLAAHEAQNQASEALSGHINGHTRPPPGAAPGCGELLRSFHQPSPTSARWAVQTSPILFITELQAGQRGG